MSPLFHFLGRMRDRLRARQRPESRIARAYGKWLDGEVRDAAVIDGPRISVVLPVFNPALPYLQAAIRSVRNQSYRNWELCVADDASPGRSVALTIADAAGQESRIKRARLASNQGIAAATNAALAMATGDFVAFLDHDDELAPHALARVAVELAEHPLADLVFSDEDHLVDGQRCAPYFKPGWNPDLMLSQNMMCHLSVYRRRVIEALGGLREDFAGSQDYDLALRAVAAIAPERIRHIPEVLYHWRQHPDSVSTRRALQCRISARAALDAHVGVAGRAEANADMPQWTRIVYALPEKAPPVSIILPAGAKAPDISGYPAVEFCEGDASGARGDVLVFFEQSLEAGRPGWVGELVSQALREGVGCVGPRLDGPDRRIAHSGFTLHPEKVAQTLAPHSDPADPGYCGHFLLCRTVSAVARAGMAVRRSVFEQLGGFDARPGRYADVDFCLRLGERGLRCVWTPAARLRYRVLPRPRRDAAGLVYMRDRWGEKLAADPYSNPNLIIRANTLDLAVRRAAPLRKPALP